MIKNGALLHQNYGFWCNAIGGIIMASVRKSISFTPQQDEWIKAQIAIDSYNSEVVRALIRQEQKRNDKFVALKAAIQEGFDSAISARTVPQIMEKVENRLRANGEL